MPVRETFKRSELLLSSPFKGKKFGLRCLAFPCNCVFFCNRFYRAHEHQQLLHEVPEARLWAGTGQNFLLIELSQAGAVQTLLLGSLSTDDGEVNGNGKKAIGLDWQNNNSALKSRFSLHFFAELNNMELKAAQIHFLSDVFVERAD